MLMNMIDRDDDYDAIDDNNGNDHDDDDDYDANVDDWLW